MDITERKITKIAREAEKLKASKAEIEASFYAYLTDTLTREEAAAFAVVLDKLYTVSYICAAWMKKLVQQAGAAYKKAAGALSAATLDRAQNAVPTASAAARAPWSAPTSTTRSIRRRCCC